MSTTRLMVTLSIGTLIGLALGVPIGRRVERALWHAENALLHTRFLGHALKAAAGPAALALTLIGLTVAAAIFLA